MRVFIMIACLVGLVSCGGELLGSTEDLFEKWSKFKAIETCFGEDVSKTFYRVI